MGTLSQMDVFELKICLENIKNLGQQIEEVDGKIASRVDHALVEKLTKLPACMDYLNRENCEYEQRSYERQTQPCTIAKISHPVSLNEESADAKAAQEIM
jgi:hypothetical protein